jgi:hypothetical protein
MRNKDQTRPEAEPASHMPYFAAQRLRQQSNLGGSVLLYDDRLEGQLTCYEISNEPLNVVSTNPVQEREKSDAVLDNVVPRRSNLLKPLQSGRLPLNVRVGRTYGEDRLSSRDSFRSSLIPIMQVDAQDFGKPMANLGACRSHFWPWVVG